MTPALSVYLNAVRVLSALLVLVAHWAFAIFTEGALEGLAGLWIGADGVVAFFVLSGLVIAYTAQEKDATLARFAFNRATRMYSVVLPAVALTLVLDAVGDAVDPAFYARSWRYDTPLAGQIWSALGFGIDVWLNRERLGTNGPLWSLCYEAWYYALFACAFYLRGWRRILCAGAEAVLMGPSMLLLLPCWLAGVWVFRRIRAQAPMPQGAAWAAALLPVALYGLLLHDGLLVRLWALPESVLGANGAREAMGDAHIALRAWIVAALIAVHFVGMASLLRERRPIGARAVGWAAGATFSLYVTHAPVLHFMKALMPDRSWLYLPACIAVAVVFAWAFERRLGALRKRLAGASARERPLPA